MSSSGSVCAPAVDTPPAKVDASKGTSAAIEDWLKQTDALSDHHLLHKPRKRKRSASPPLETDVSDSESERLEPTLGKMASPLKVGQIPPLTPARTTSTRSISSPTSESQTSRSSLLKISTSSDWIGNSMKRHGLLFKDREAWDHYPDFRQEILDIVNPVRDSGVKARSVQKFQERVAEYEGANEDSFLDNVLPRIIKETHRVGQSQATEETGRQLRMETISGSQEDAVATVATIGELQQEYRVHDYYEEGLRMTRNSEFRRNTLPNKYLEHGLDQKIAQALAKVDGMTNPRPDYTYGLKRPPFPSPHNILLSSETEMLLEIAPFVHQAFLIIEGKSDRGELAEAENQARRGGAALVNAGRLLRQRIGEDSGMGPDRRTFVFSVTVSPKIMEVWVHWAEVLEAETVFHMHLVASKSLSDDEALVVLRRKLHNILDWGTCGRMGELEKLYTRIYESERERLNYLVVESRERGREREIKKRKMDEIQSASGSH